MAVNGDRVTVRLKKGDEVIAPRGEMDAITTTITGSFVQDGKTFYTTKAYGKNQGFAASNLLKIGAGHWASKKKSGRVLTASGKTKKQKRGSMI